MAVNNAYKFLGIAEFNEAGTFSSAPDAATDFETVSSPLIMVRDDFRAGGPNGDGFHYATTGVHDGGFTDLGATNLSATGLYGSSNYVVAGQEPGVGESSAFMRVRVVSPQGTSTTFQIDDANSSEADVAGLVGGGFALVSKDDDAFFDTVDVRIYGVSGLNATQVASFVIATSVSDVGAPQVVGLDNGSFVVVWTENSATLKAAIYNAAGGVIRAPYVLDNFGTINRNPSVTATSTGFAVVYEDNGWATETDVNITLAHYDFDGSLNGERYNLTAGDTADNDEGPSVSRLSNNMLAVTYGDNAAGTGDTDLQLLLWDSGGREVLASVNVFNGTTISQLFHDIEAITVAGFGQGKVGVFWTDITSGATRGKTINVVNEWTGDDVNNDISGDSLADVVNAGRGNDRITAATGSNTINGQGGWDKAIYGIASTSATLTRTGSGQWTLRSTVPDISDALTGVEVVQFTNKTVALRERPATDLNGEGTSDLVLQNGGTVVDWLMQGGTFQSGNVITSGAVGYAVVGKGDLDADGDSDLLLQSGGTVVDWIMQNGIYLSGAVITNGAVGYQIVGTGDFDVDGDADILLQNGGTVVTWRMQNGAFQSGAVITNGAIGYAVVGTGDFDRDGDADVLLQNGGTVVTWLMQNGAYESGAVITNGAIGYTVVGTGDFDGDGDADVVLQAGSSIVTWLMEGGNYQTGLVLTNSAGGFQVADVGDYNNDGTADIALQNGGTVVNWIMQGGAVVGSNLITNGATGFTVV